MYLPLIAEVSSGWTSIAGCRCGGTCSAGPISGAASTAVSKQLHDVIKLYVI